MSASQPPPTATPKTGKKRSTRDVYLELSAENDKVKKVGVQGVPVLVQQQKIVEYKKEAFEIWKETQLRERNTLFFAIVNNENIVIAGYFTNEGNVQYSFLLSPVRFLEDGLPYYRVAEAHERGIPRIAEFTSMSVVVQEKRSAHYRDLTTNELNLAKTNALFWFGASTEDNKPIVFTWDGRDLAQEEQQYLFNLLPKVQTYLRSLESNEMKITAVYELPVFTAVKQEQLTIHTGNELETHSDAFIPLYDDLNVGAEQNVAASTTDAYSLSHEGTIVAVWPAQYVRVMQPDATRRPLPLFSYEDADDANALSQRLQAERVAQQEELRKLPFYRLAKDDAEYNASAIKAILQFVCVKIRINKSTLFVEQFYAKSSIQNRRLPVLANDPNSLTISFSRLDYLALLFFRLFAHIVQIAKKQNLLAIDSHLLNPSVICSYERIRLWYSLGFTEMYAIMGGKQVEQAYALKNPHISVILKQLAQETPAAAQFRIDDTRLQIAVHSLLQGLPRVDDAAIRGEINKLK